MSSAETQQPALQGLTAFGRPSAYPLVTSEGWRALQDIGIEEGMVALGYEGQYGEYARLYHFAKYHLFSGSCAMVTCPSAMTDGAASLLSRHADEGGVKGNVFAEVRERLVSRELGYAWTSGQWMTERRGGSDVSGTETVATLVGDDGGKDAHNMPLGPWKIDGFKWFSSATDANCTVLLAQTGKKGSLSAFYAPMRRIGKEGEVEMNGVRIQRLKNKLGTKPVPTAELELKGMRAYMVGKEGEGVKEISTILNITRVHNIVSGMGEWGRGLAVSRAFARVRRVGGVGVTGGKVLSDVPAHVRGMADEHVKYAAYMHLSFLTVRLLGISEDSKRHSSKKRELRASSSNPLHIPETIEDAGLMLRLLTPLAKAQTALATIYGLRFCMESMGGVGYLENHEEPLLNIARLFRDANVLSIWEGTTDVMADDVARVIKGPRGEDVLRVMKEWVHRATKRGGKVRLNSERGNMLDRWTAWEDMIRHSTKEELKWKGRDVMEELDKIVCGCLLVLDAESDGNELSREKAKRWIDRPFKEDKVRSWEAHAAWDKKIVFGTESSEKPRL
jgi:alkylation response protein AidB-like acyl-CoA dehydrogenase